MKFLYIAACIPALAASFTATAAFTSTKVASSNTVATNSLFNNAKVFNPFELKAKEGDADFEKKKIIVLGGDGFCGWPTSLHLSDAGHDVVIVDNLARRNIDTELGCSSLTPIQPPEVRSERYYHHEIISCSSLIIYFFQLLTSQPTMPSLHVRFVSRHGRRFLERKSSSRILILQRSMISLFSSSRMRNPILLFTSLSSALPLTL